MPLRAGMDALDFFADNGCRRSPLSLHRHGSSPGFEAARQMHDHNINDVSFHQACRHRHLISELHGRLIRQKFLGGAGEAATILMVRTDHELPSPRCGGGEAPWLAVRVDVARKSLTCLRPWRARAKVCLRSHSGPIVEECWLDPRGSRRLGSDIELLDLVRARQRRDAASSKAPTSHGSATARENARVYHTEAEFFPDMGHNMMLEPGWQAVAERIDGWLTARGL